MPKILVVAATHFEIAPLLKQFKIAAQQPGLFASQVSENISVLITGVGMVNTAYYMGFYAQQQFDYIVNAGICGSFNKSLEMGEVVHVITDTISELGAEDGDAFIKYEDLQLGGTAVYENKNIISSDALSALKQVKGITVNKVHGHDQNIQTIVSLFDPGVESMEGAAFFRGCEQGSAQYAQVRAISNAVEKRDKSKWNIQLAINNLNNFLIPFINSLNP